MRPFVFVLVAATTTLSVALAAPAGGQKDEDLYLEGLEDQEEQEQEEQGWASQDLAYLQLLTDPQGSQLEEALSRAGALRLPGRRKSPPFADSPVYYIRMPPSPYVFVPGMGYVSQPPPPPPPPPRFSPFINLPLDFVANGKPTHVYRWPKPKPSTVHQLDNGPYVFNGKPSDKVQVLRDQYNALYADALQNLYP